MGLFDDGIYVGILHVSRARVPVLSEHGDSIIRTKRYWVREDLSAAAHGIHKCVMAYQDVYLKQQLPIFPYKWRNNASISVSDYFFSAPAVAGSQILAWLSRDDSVFVGNRETAVYVVT